MKKKMKKSDIGQMFLIQTDSEQPGRAHADRSWTEKLDGEHHKDPEHTAQFWADVSHEKVHLYRCIPVKDIYPTVVIPKVPAERKRLCHIAAIKCALTSSIARFNDLPKKGSFGGIAYASEIEKLQRDLDALGDKGTRFHPEINIEVG